MMKFSQTIIRLATAMIPVKSARKRIRRRLMDRLSAAWIARTVPQVRRRYEELEQAFRARVAAGNRLNVCFLVCDASMFSAEPVCQAMCRDARFEPFIAVVPRVSRGEKFLRETLRKTVGELSARYPFVRCLYDPETKAEESLKGRADIVFTSIVYDDQTLERYTALSLSRHALVACVPYGYGGQLLSDVRRMVFLPQLAFFWRLFVANPETLALWKRSNPILAGNLVLGGYPKMDRLVEMPVRSNRPKTILICPHHTLARTEDGLSLSNFLRFADFFLELPKEFPDVYFVFRPHPLLFPRLATSAWWGERRTDAYRKKMESLPNVEFQQGGDYFDSFANSDAMIHDCGSFLAEYFYTGRPQCYVLADETVIDREFTPFGKKLHRHVAHAFSEDDIRDFVRKVVDGSLVRETASQEAFARGEVCIFHPHAADRVINELTRILS